MGKPEEKPQDGRDLVAGAEPSPGGTCLPLRPRLDGRFRLLRPSLGGWFSQSWPNLRKAGSRPRASPKQACIGPEKPCLQGEGFQPSPAFAGRVFIPARQSVTAPSRHGDPQEEARCDDITQGATHDKPGSALGSRDTNTKALRTTPEPKFSPDPATPTASSRQKPSLEQLQEATAQRNSQDTQEWDTSHPATSLQTAAPAPLMLQTETIPIKDLITFWLELQ
ncbi:uncharacterized protein M8220_002455 [Acridotheres tristis]